MSHVTWAGNITHTSESCHTCARVTSRTWINHVTYTNDSGYACEWNLWRIWTSHHVTHMNERYPPHDWSDMTLSHVWHALTWHSHILKWHYSFTWSDITLSLSNVSFTWSDITLSLKWHYSFTDWSDIALSHVWHGLTWHSHISDITLSHVWHGESSCYIYKRVLYPHDWAMSHMWKSPVMYMTMSCHVYEWIMSHIWIGDISHTSESCHTCERV